MTRDLIQEMQDWKMYNWETITADALLARGPGFLIDAIIASNGSGVANAVVYDGYNTSGKVILPLRCKDDDLEAMRHSIPLFYEQGLYVDIGENVAGVLLHWIPDMAHIKGYPEINQRESR